MGRYGVKPDAECNTPCHADKSRKCGGSWRNSVFSLEAVKKPEVIVKYDALFGESVSGCYKDSGNRDLPNLIRAGYGNPKKCF